MTAEWEFEEERGRRRASRRQAPPAQRPMPRKRGKRPWIFEPKQGAPEARSGGGSAALDARSPEPEPPYGDPSADDPTAQGGSDMEPDGDGGDEESRAFTPWVTLGELVAEPFEWECELCGAREKAAARRPAARHPFDALSLDEAETFEFPFP